MNSYLDKNNIRYFEKFPDELKCPICGESSDDFCVLVGIDGTSEGNIEEAKPIHLKCLLNGSKLRINLQAGLIYQKLSKE